MKTSLPLCTLVLIAVGLTMVQAACDRQSLLACAQRTPTSSNNQEAYCKEYRTYISCVENTCPGEDIASITQAVTNTSKQLGYDCSHASHLVSAQAMPVLLFVIIGLFFGVF